MCGSWHFHIFNGSCYFQTIRASCFSSLLATDLPPPLLLSAQPSIKLQSTFSINHPTTLSSREKLIWLQFVFDIFFQEAVSHLNKPQQNLFSVIAWKKVTIENVNSNHIEIESEWREYLRIMVWFDMEVCIIFVILMTNEQHTSHWVVLSHFLTSCHAEESPSNIDITMSYSGWPKYWFPYSSWERVWFS